MLCCWEAQIVPQLPLTADYRSEPGGGMHLEETLCIHSFDSCGSTASARFGRCKGLRLQSSGEPDIKQTCRQICDSSNKEK